MLCVKSRYDEILADQDALNLCRHILAEGQVCTCLFNQVCLGNLHVLTTVVTAVQMRRSIVHPSLAKRLVQRGSLVLVGSVLEFPSTLHAEYFRQVAVSCQGPLASETYTMHVIRGLPCRYQQQCRYHSRHMATPAREALPGMPFHRLLELTIERMQPLQLPQSLNTDKRLRMNGRHYKMDYYRCGQPCLQYAVVQLLSLQLLVVAGPCCHSSQSTGSGQMWAPCSAAGAC